MASPSVAGAAPQMPASVRAGSKATSRAASRNRRLIDSVVLYALFTSHLLTFCFYIVAINANLMRLAQATYIGIILVYLVLAFLKRRLLIAAIAFVLIVGLLLYEQNHFAATHAIAPNFNATIAFIAIGGYLVFLQTPSLSLQDKFSVVLRIAVVYSTIYVVFHEQLIALSHAAGQGVMVAPDERGARLMCALAYVGAGIAVLVGRLRYERPSLVRTGLNLLLLVPLVAALLMAQSRLFTVLILVSILVYLIVPFRWFSRWAATGIVIAATALLACVPLGINPFEIVKTDNSGRARMLVYERARDILVERPFLGLGITSGEDSVAEKVVEINPNADFATKTVTLFPSDLSYLGAWLQFGLFGALALIVSVPFAVSGALGANTPRSTWLAARALGLAAVVYAPSNIGGTFTMFYAMLIAQHVMSRTVRVRPGPGEGARQVGGDRQDAPGLTKSFQATPAMSARPN